MSGIKLIQVSKNYGKVKALNDVSVHFEENKIYGLLGRNGAGKTTMLKAMYGMIFPNDGLIQVDNMPALENDSAHEKMFFMGEDNYFSSDMRIKKIFYWMKQFRSEFDAEYAMELCKYFGLDIKKKPKHLSTGYSSIFKLICVLASNAQYLLFDEPVLGLDANHRDMFYKAMLKKFVEKPFTAIISTHLIEEVADVIEHVVIVKEGQIIRDESIESILNAGYTVSGVASAVDTFILDKEVLGVESLGGLKTAFVLGDREEYNIPGDIDVSKMDLQRLFIQLTQS